MIDYNPKDWFTFIFRFHKADTFRKLFSMLIAIGVYSFLIAYIETHFTQTEHNEHLKELPIMHATLGFVISMLLVFRTNTAYDRWWEGRRQWGALVNSSRNFILKINTFLASPKDKIYFKIMAPNFAFALKNHLRGDKIETDFENTSELKFNDLSIKNNLPLHILNDLYLKSIQLQQEGKIDPIQLKSLLNDLSVFTDVMGACERIKNTPIPFSYSVFLKKFIFFFTMTLPMGYVFKLGYFCIPVVVFIFYVLASLELIAEEIEDPFGTEENDLPTERICNTIRANVYEIIN